MIFELKNGGTSGSCKTSMRELKNSKILLYKSTSFINPSGYN